MSGCGKRWGSRESEETKGEKSEGLIRRDQWQENTSAEWPTLKSSVPADAVDSILHTLNMTTKKPKVPLCKVHQVRVTAKLTWNLACGLQNHQAVKYCDAAHLIFFLPTYGFISRKDSPSTLSIFRCWSLSSAQVYQNGKKYFLQYASWMCLTKNMEEGCCKLSMQLSDYTQPIQCLPHYHDTVQKRLHLAFLNSQNCLNKICFFFKPRSLN